MNQKVQKIFGVLFCCLVGVALVKAFLLPPVGTIQASDEMIALECGWEEQQKDIQGNDYSEYSCVIPKDAGNSLILAVKGYHFFVEAFLNEEEIYSYEDTHMEKGFFWKCIELPENASGQKLTVRLAGTGENNVSAFGKNVYLGEKNAVFLKILAENMYAVFWAVATVFVGSAICISSLILWGRVDERVGKGVTYLGIFILLAGIWIVTDSQLMQFLTGRTAAISVVSFLCFMLMPYFLLKFVEKMMLYENGRIKMLSRLHLISIAICFSLYLLRLLPLSRVLPVVHLLIIVSVIIVLKYAIVEIRRHNNKEMKKIALGILALIVFGSIALVCFYVELNSLYAMFYGVGLLVFLGFLIGAVIDRLRYYLMTSANAEKYRKIANMDIMTGLENRMAFTKQKEKDDENNSCVVFDINNLKTANDEYGHQEGDRLIVDATKCIRAAFENVGRCYRIGGDEFVVLLPDTAEKVILDAIKRLEQCTKEANIERTVPLEIAYGYAIRDRENITFDDMFMEADANMYMRKQKMKAQK